jgi:hypothetical protein
LVCGFDSFIMLNFFIDDIQQGAVGERRRAQLECAKCSEVSYDDPWFLLPLSLLWFACFFWIVSFKSIYLSFSDFLVGKIYFLSFMFLFWFNQWFNVDDDLNRLFLIHNDVS